MKKLILITLVMAGVTLWASSREEKRELARETAANGIVLLENKDGVLPLAKGEEIVLVGFPGYFCIRQGWGSGDMMEHRPVQYDEGLEKAGIKLDADFAKLYRDLRAERLARGEYDRINLDWFHFTTRFEEPDLYGEKFAEFAKGKRAKKCVLTIGRGAGESLDIPEEAGGFRLHWQEDLLLKAACENFDNVIVLLNGPGVMDTSFLDKYPVKAFVFTSYLGEVSGDAVADVLTGKVNPSGKTVDTWAKRYCDYPTTDCFGTSEVPYLEDVFVGYRYFDRCPEKVRYPFGYGLSYTTFRLEQREGAEFDGKVVKVPFKVTNTGKRAGATVVQVYLVSPESEDIPQPLKRLCAFKKTPVIPAGKSAKIDIEFALTDFAIYSEKLAAWILEKGDYSLLAGFSSREVMGVDDLDIKVPFTVVEQVRNRFGGQRNEINRKAIEKTKDQFVTFEDVMAGKATPEDLVAQFTDEELIFAINGRPLGNEGLKVEGGTGVGGVKNGVVDCEAGESWSSEKYKIPAITCADGPSGVRLGNFNEPVTNYNVVGKQMFAWPCATALAQGWSPEAAEKFGRCIAEDMLASKIDCWLAPGVNIHRNPLNGRNFEYPSEDPYLGGVIGAGIVRGVQTREDGTLSGCIATVKHFCTNNQEFNRGSENNIVSERALREIYLKPFELCVKLAAPHAIMTSYNQFNGDYAATTYDLVTGVLREEWGYKGFVMTDWWDQSDKLRHPLAGNDLVMPGCAGYINPMLKGIKDGSIRRADAEHAAVNVIKATMLRKNYR